MRANHAVRNKPRIRMWGFIRIFRDSPESSFLDIGISVEILCQMPFYYLISKYLPWAESCKHIYFRRKYFNIMYILHVFKKKNYSMILGEGIYIPMLSDKFLSDNCF